MMNEKSLAKKLYEKYVPVLEDSKHMEYINTFTLKDMPIESMEEIVNALKIASDLKDRNMDLETLENYMKFEDECVKKNFTFKSILEAREKQIAKKPFPHPDNRKMKYCPSCGSYYGMFTGMKYCVNCGQKLDWE